MMEMVGQVPRATEECAGGPTSRGWRQTAHPQSSTECGLSNQSLGLCFLIQGFYQHGQALFQSPGQKQCVGRMGNGVRGSRDVTRSS